MTHVSTTVDMKQDTNILVVYSNFFNVAFLLCLEKSKVQRLESRDNYDRIKFP